MHDYRDYFYNHDYLFFLVITSHLDEYFKKNLFYPFLNLLKKIEFNCFKELS